MGNSHTPEERASVVHDVHGGGVEEVPEAHDPLRGDVLHQAFVQAQGGSVNVYGT